MYLDRRAGLLHTAGEDGALRAWQLKAAPQKAPSSLLLLGIMFYYFYSGSKGG